MRVLQLFAGLRHRRHQFVTNCNGLTMDLAVDGDPMPPAALARQDEPEYIWPEDPDEVPDWRIAQEGRAFARGYSLPPYRTRRQWELAIERAETLAARMISPAEPAPLAEALSPMDAATQFLDWLQDDVDTKPYSAHELSAHYSLFCEEKRLTPTPVDHMKAAFTLLTHAVNKRQISKVDTATGKRHRNFVYFVSPRCETNIPFDLHPDDVMHPDELKLAA